MTVDVIVVTHFLIFIQKSAPTICTSRRAGKLPRFGFGQQHHRHVARKNGTYHHCLGKYESKEICHHVFSRIYDGVCSVGFMVRDAIDATSRRDVVCVDIGLIGGGGWRKHLKSPTR